MKKKKRSRENDVSSLSLSSSSNVRGEKMLKKKRRSHDDNDENDVDEQQQQERQDTSSSLSSLQRSKKKKNTKKKKKNSTTTETSSSSSSWRKVSVRLGGGGTNNDDDDSEGDQEEEEVVEMNDNKKKNQTRWNDNHYDNHDNDDDENDYEDDDLLTMMKKKNSKRFKSAARTSDERAELELEAQPGEHVAIFYGLEVLDGNAYKVMKQKDKEGKEEEKESTATKNSKDLISIGEGGKGKNNNNDKKKTVEETKNEHHDDDNDDDVMMTETTTTKKKKSKKKNKKKNSTTTTTRDDDDTNKKDPRKTTTEGREEEKEDTANVVDDNIDDDTIDKMQQSWLVATGGITLHKQLCFALIKQDFWLPTPIQQATLPAAILGRRNLVGAAPTGSGKTLAFLLPICQYILEKEDEIIDPVKNNNNDDDQQQQLQDIPLQALIITPTRELAMQIHTECTKLMSMPTTSSRQTRRKSYSATLVGGFAHVKQQRVLTQSKPPIIIGTPGRLWELISSREHAHLNNLTQLKFLVIDEADRMISQGHFPQLKQIFNQIHISNPMLSDEEDSDDEGDEVDDDDDQHQNDVLLPRLPGIQGEARVEMLNDKILRKLEEQRKEDLPPKDATTTTTTLEDHQDDDEDNNESLEDENDDESSEDDDDIVLLNNDDGENNIVVNDDDDEDTVEQQEPVIRQTFVYSATLTLPSNNTTASSFKNKSSKKKGTRNNNKHQNKGDDHITGVLAEILEKSHAKGKTKVVDLTTTTTNSSGKQQPNLTTKSSSSTTTTTSTKTTKFQLPPGLHLKQIKCTQRHKDSHLYAYLVTHEDMSGNGQQGEGPCLIFCNSIACVRRVSTTLEMLNVHVRVLHANMQQRARMKVIEALRKASTTSTSQKQLTRNRVVVVATDVAARGLDIPSVSTVIHYDIPRTIDTFIHRSGRTARGMGEDAVGCSLSLISPNEDKMHQSITSSTGIRFENVNMDGRLLTKAQERTNLATKIVQLEDHEQHIRKNNQWFIDKANEAGLEIDDYMLDDELASSGNKRDRAKVCQAQNARKRLHTLLKETMQTQRYGKFLSTNSSAKASMQRQRR